MKVFPLVLVAVSVAILARSVHAQEEDLKISPPTFPLKLRTPEMAAWTVHTKKSSAPESWTQPNASSVSDASTPGTTPAAPPKITAAQLSLNASPEDRVQRLSVTKTFPIYEESATVLGGPNWDKWTFLLKRTYRFVKSVGAPGWKPQGDVQLGSDSKYETSDFADLEWADQKSFQGVQLLNKAPAYYFEKKSGVPLTVEDKRTFDYAVYSLGKSTRIFTYRAWFDVKSLLPLRLDDGKRVRDYTYGPAPTSRLTPPAEIIEQLKKWIAADKQNER